MDIIPFLPLFRDVCRQRGLLQADGHWQQSMQDVEKTRIPRAMRDLFVILQSNNKVNNSQQCGIRSRVQCLKISSKLRGEILMNEYNHDQ